MAILFDEILFDPSLITAWGSGSPEFANTQIRNPASGIVKTNVSRSDPLEGATLDLSLLTPANREYFLNFWRGGYGNAVGFRARIPTDYIATLEAFAVGNGSALTFPLSKTYTRPGVTARQDVRRIVKPVVAAARETNAVLLSEPDGVTNRVIGTAFQIYISGAEQIGETWKVNAYTGLVTFTVAPANGAIIAWSGEFDVPIAFLGNSFNQKYDVSSDINGVGIREIHYTELGIT